MITISVVLRSYSHNFRPCFARASPLTVATDDVPVPKFCVVQPTANSDVCAILRRLFVHFRDHFVPILVANIYLP